MTSATPLFGDAYAKSNGLQTRLDFWNRFGTAGESIGPWIARRICDEASDVSRYLDVGFGTGLLFGEVLTAVKPAKADGIDYSKAMVYAASKKLAAMDPSPKLQVGNAEKLPYGKETFDLVSAMHVLHHVSGINDAIGELYRVLARDGLLVVMTANFDPYSGLNSIHYDAIRSLGLPRFLLDTTEYQRFAPKTAAEVLSTRFSIEQDVYSNDAICTSVDEVMAYYRSAMAKRGIAGVDDSRVSTSQQRALIEKVQTEVSEVINRTGYFRQPGGVTAYFCRRQS